MADYLFIDLHMHSAYSNEDLCDESPKHILSKVQGYVEKYNKNNQANVNCCISIADHNSIMASVEARKLIDSGLYPNVKYINGCEFTTDLCEVNQAIGLPNCFTRGHILAYNYDENDKELQSYSIITHKRFTNEDNIGLQILASRRAVCEEYNIDIPFSSFIKLASLGLDDDYYSAFVAVVKNYFYKNNIKFDREKIDECITHFLVGARNYVEDATNYGRLKLSEVSKLIRNAGGKLVLAHPAILKVSVNDAEALMNKYGIPITTKMQGLIERDKKRDVAFKLGNEAVEVVLKEFLNAVPLVCEGACLDGLETTMGINFYRRTDGVIFNVCKNGEYFQTCGSDYHGENFATHKTIGNCFEQELQKDWGVAKAKIQDRELFIRIANLPFVDYCVDGKNIETFDAKYIDEEFNEISKDELFSFIDESKSKAKKRQREKKQKQVNSEAKKSIENLTFIAESYNDILNKGISIKHRRQLIVALEKFCHGIYASLQKLQSNFREHSEAYDVEDVKKITTLLKELHRKYFEMVRLDNGARHYVKNALKHEKGMRKTVLDRIANITMQEKPKEIKEEKPKDKVAILQNSPLDLTK